eukprot:m.91773 g.91773  ORF g.91773 m.91773 type:complete len:259 (+) comp13750_c0_seq3:91-867(+)
MGRNAEERVALIDGTVVASGPRTWIRPCLAEFLGTMLFVFLGCGAVVSDGYLDEGAVEQPKVIAISLAHGFAIAVLVYATAKISGGQLNPAVTLSLMVLGKEPVRKAILIGISQVVGGLCGAAWLLAVFPVNSVGRFKASLDSADYGAHMLADDISVRQGFLMEMMLTFVLVFVILRVAVDPDNMGNMAPLAIGLTVAALHLVGINVTGASMNPARSFGPAVVGDIWYDHWIYWIGPFTGSLLATAVYHFVFRTDTRS